MRPELLIMGGTTEGRELARAVDARFGDRLGLISSLKGDLTDTASLDLPGQVRTGGYGGLEGLLAFLTGATVTMAIDATHPFAVNISHTLRLACEQTGIPRLTLTRDPWEKADGDTWIEVPDNAAAADMVSHLGRRPFLTLGPRDLMAYSGLSELHFTVRQINTDGESPPLADYTLVHGRGPFKIDDEIELMKREKIDVLVTKASGGPATRAKIEAARELKIPVLLIARPEPEPGETVTTVDAALDWIETRLENS